MKEAARLGGEEYSMHKLYQKIFGYPHWRLSAPLHEAPATEGQAMETVKFIPRTLLSNLGNWKKCNRARFTSFNVHTPSI